MLLQLPSWPWVGTFIIHMHFQHTTHTPCGCPFLPTDPNHRLQVTACEIHEHPPDGPHFRSILMEQKKSAFILLCPGKCCHPRRVTRSVTTGSKGPEGWWDWRDSVLHSEVIKDWKEKPVKKAKEGVAGRVRARSCLWNSLWGAASQGSLKCLSLGSHDDTIEAQCGKCWVQRTFQETLSPPKPSVRSQRRCLQLSFSSFPSVAREWMSAVP